MLILFYKHHSKTVMSLSFPASCDNMVLLAQQFIPERTWSPDERASRHRRGAESRAGRGELLDPPPQHSQLRQVRQELRGGSTEGFLGGREEYGLSFRHGGDVSW